MKSSPFFPPFNEETLLLLEINIAKGLGYYQPQNEEFKSVLFKYSILQNEAEKAKQEAELNNRR